MTNTQAARLNSKISGGEREIRTLDGSFPPYSLSRRAPSTTRPFLHYPVYSLQMAEEVGFEPTKLLHLTVFKTAAFNHSATPPCWSAFLYHFVWCRSIPSGQTHLYFPCTIAGIGEFAYHITIKFMALQSNFLCRNRLEVICFSSKTRYRR